LESLDSFINLVTLSVTTFIDKAYHWRRRRRTPVWKELDASLASAIYRPTAQVNVSLWALLWYAEKENMVKIESLEHTKVKTVEILNGARTSYGIVICLPIRLRLDPR
jgi:hypothetical protein